MSRGRVLLPVFIPETLETLRCAGIQTTKRPSCDDLILVFWSGRRDSNSRPLAPHASALPGCATPRTEGRVYMTLPKKSNQSSPPAIRFVVTRLLSVPDGWNVTTRRSVIVTVSPVFRLRPASHLVANREVAETRDLHRITLSRCSATSSK